MQQHANKKEMDRRKAKKSHEIFDERLTNYLESLTQKEFNDWAKKYPKEAMAFAVARMPKVQSVDQDLQKSVISLRTLLEELPDTEDIYKINKKLKRELSQTLNELNTVKADRDNMRRLIVKLQKKLKQ